MRISFRETRGAISLKNRESKDYIFKDCFVPLVKHILFNTCMYCFLATKFRSQYLFQNPKSLKDYFLMVAKRKLETKSNGTKKTKYFHITDHKNCLRLRGNNKSDLEIFNVESVLTKVKGIPSHDKLIKNSKYHNFCISLREKVYYYFVFLPKTPF